MAKKSGLGNNFDDTIFDDDGLFGAEESIAPQKLKIIDIEPNKKQPRKTFNEEALNALAESILEHGVIQPLTVRPYDMNAAQPSFGIAELRAERRKARQILNGRALL